MFWRMKSIFVNMLCTTRMHLFSSEKIFATRKIWTATFLGGTQRNKYTIRLLGCTKEHLKEARCSEGRSLVLTKTNCKRDTRSVGSWVRDRQRKMWNRTSRYSTQGASSRC